MRSSILNKYLFLGVLITLVGCQEDMGDGSNTQSLDNFAGDDFSVNSCGPQQAGLRSPSFIQGSSQGKSSALRAYAAIPKNLHSAIFKKQGGVILGKAASCGSLTAVQKKFANEDGKGAQGCWKIKDRKVTLMLPDNQKWIRHSLLRLSGYVYSEFIGKNARSAKSSTLRAASSSFIGERKKLANAFIADMGGMKKLNPRLKLLAKSGTSDFGNFVLAEAIDSYYCNKKTNASFQAKFPKSYRVFTSGSKSLRKDLGPAFWQ